MITIPILALFIYIIGTYFPLIYEFVPFLGKIKIVLLAGIVLLVSFVLTHHRYTNTTAYRNPIVYAWIAFLCFMMLGIFGSLDRGQTLEIIEINLKYFLVFLVMIKIIDTIKRIERLLQLFTFCAVGMGLQAIYNYMFNMQVLGSYGDLTGGYRAIALEKSVFGDPNDLALLLITVLPFAVYFLMVNARKIWPLLGVLILTSAVVLTHSRAGFVGLCVTGLAFLLFFMKTQKKYAILFVGFALLLWSVAPESYKERISTITAWEADELTGKTGTRIDSWKVAITEGLKHPILGVGAGSGVYVMGKTSKDWHDIHNAFIQVFVEMGILGFMAYLSLFAIPFRRHSVFMRNHNLENDLSRVDLLYKVTRISFLAFAITAFFTPQAYSPLLYTLTAIAIIGFELMKKQKESLHERVMDQAEYRYPMHEVHLGRI